MAIDVDNDDGYRYYWEVIGIDNGGQRGDL